MLLAKNDKWTKLLNLEDYLTLHWVSIETSSILVENPQYLP